MSYRKSHILFDTGGIQGYWVNLSRMLPELTAVPALATIYYSLLICWIGKEHRDIPCKAAREVSQNVVWQFKFRAIAVEDRTDAAIQKHYAAVKIKDDLIKHVGTSVHCGINRFIKGLGAIAVSQAIAIDCLLCGYVLLLERWRRTTIGRMSLLSFSINNRLMPLSFAITVPVGQGTSFCIEVLVRENTQYRICVRPDGLLRRG